MSIKRYEMTDSQRNQTKLLLFIAKTERPSKENWMIFNVILWIARSGSVWRDLPERFGSWKTFTAASVNSVMMAQCCCKKEAVNHETNQ